MLIVPLWPIESHFVLEDSLDGFRSFPVSLNSKSIALGYLRWWSFLGIVLGSLLWLENGAVLLLSWSLFSWAVSALILGGCPREELKQRKILKYTTGISAQPEIQPPDMRAEIFQTLALKLAQLETKLDGEGWREISAQPGGEKIAGFAYSTAKYGIHCEPPEKWVNESEDAWKIIEANWNYWFHVLNP
jgi:hypothetical protein